MLQKEKQKEENLFLRSVRHTERTWNNRKYQLYVVHMLHTVFVKRKIVKAIQTEWHTLTKFYTFSIFFKFLFNLKNQTVVRGAYLWTWLNLAHKSTYGKLHIIKTPCHMLFKCPGSYTIASPSTKSSGFCGDSNFHKYYNTTRSTRDCNTKQWMFVN